VELILLVLLLLVLARLPKKQPSAGDRGIWLPALRMGAAALFAVLIGLMVMELL
jgi:hypothetical protein